MILSGHQPTYLPGILLFSKIALSDKFMFVGHCQASPGTWHNRNRIRGCSYLTIPIRNEFGVSINETRFAGDNWKRKHLRSMEMAYSKAPYFDRYYIPLAKFYELDWDTLGPFNIELIRNLCEWLDIKTPILDSRDFQSPDWGHKTDMLINMCRATGCNQYLSNAGSIAYVDENKMATRGIKHLWQRFTHPIYDQGHPEFLTNLSVIDLLFNKGPEAGQIVRQSGYIG